ncbi:MAG: response regulator [Acidobacteriota bacterium]
MKPLKGHILVVDDDEANRDLLRRRLERRGCVVTLAEDGPQAIEMAHEQKFDLILLDVMMPGMSGIEVLKIIRQTQSPVDLPVIMVTAKDRSEDVVAGFQDGANDYATKPLDFPVVMARVETQLSLRRLAQLKDDFMKIASHDLQNPLTIVLGSAKMLKKMVPPGSVMTEDAFQMVGLISRGAARMQRMIEDFLDFHALQDGRLTLALTATDLNQMAEEAVKANAQSAAEKEITLSLDLDPSLPPTDADGPRLSQVVQNLVGNAIKFCPPGSRATVRTRMDGAYARIEVSDTGPGLTDEDMKKVFTKYARLSNKPTGGERSSGLGLAISKQLVDLHGGDIGVKNNESGGACFWFRLPLAARGAGTDS